MKKKRNNKLLWTDWWKAECVSRTLDSQRVCFVSQQKSLGKSIRPRRRQAGKSSCCGYLIYVLWQHVDRQRETSLIDYDEFSHAPNTRTWPQIKGSTVSRCCEGSLFILFVLLIFVKPAFVFVFVLPSFRVNVYIVLGPSLLLFVCLFFFLLRTSKKVCTHIVCLPFLIYTSTSEVINGN